MAGTTMTVLGLKELEDNLRQLPKKVAKKVVRRAVKRAAAVVRKEARSNARTMVGGELGIEMARSIATGKGKAVRDGYTVRVGPRKSDNDKFYGITAAGRRFYKPAAVEYGHDGVAANAFMRSAWDATKLAALSVMTKEIRAGLEAEAAKG